MNKQTRPALDAGASAPPIPLFDTLTNVVRPDGSASIYVGDWMVTPRIIAPLYVDADFWRDRKGNKLSLTFFEQISNFTACNDGRTYGNGCSSAIGAAIIDGRYRLGDRFHLPLEFMIGKNICGGRVEGESVFSLLQKKTPGWDRISYELTHHSNPPWVFTGTEHAFYNTFVYSGNIRTGDILRLPKQSVLARSDVLSCCAYEIQHL